MVVQALEPETRRVIVRFGFVGKQVLLVCAHGVRPLSIRLLICLLSLIEACVELFRIVC